MSLQWFEEKLQEVESADQYFRKLHALVESLVVHRKGFSSTDLLVEFRIYSPVLTFFFYIKLGNRIICCIDRNIN